MAHGHHHPLQKLSLEALIEALRAEHMRITPTRVAILGVLLASKSPMSLEEIQQAAEAAGAHPNYVTVFRTMAALEKLGLAHKVALNRSCAYFELDDPGQHKDHITCTECGHVTLMQEECPVSALEKRIEKSYGFSNVKHSLEFFGTCKSCTTAKPA